jgi:hypothetical protein
VFMSSFDIHLIIRFINSVIVLLSLVFMKYSNGRHILCYDASVIVFTADL